jgi:hypothetical protein
MMSQARFAFGLLLAERQKSNRKRSSDNAGLCHALIPARLALT